MQYYYLIIPIGCALFSIVMGLLFLKQLPPSTKLLVLGALLSIASDLLAFNAISKSINSQIHNIYILIDFYLLLYASYSLYKGKMRTVFTSVSAVVYAAVWLFFIVKNGFSQFAYMAFPFSSLLTVINYLITLYYNEVKPNASNLAPVRILCFALIVYHCGTFTIFMAIEFLMKDKIFGPIVDINTALDSLKYVALGVAYYRFKKQGFSIE
jgi:hypothetical protein